MSLTPDLDSSEATRPRWMVVLAVALIIGIPLVIQIHSSITDPDAYGMGYFAWTMFAR